jgi:hypothetical protein
MKPLAVRLGPVSVLIALCCLVAVAGFFILEQGQQAEAAPAAKPVVGFTASTFVAQESDGAAEITVRVDPLPEAGRRVAVRYEASAGTATEGPGGDFISATGVLTFTRNTPALLSFVVPINDDVESGEPDETVNLSLELLTPNNATLGRDQATLIIIDNDGPTPTPTPSPPPTRPADLDESSYLQPILGDQGATKTPPAPPPLIQE